MTFNIVVKVDTSQALPAVKSVEQGLDKGAKAATGLGAAARTAMNEAKIAAERAAAAAEKFNQVVASGHEKSSAGYVKAKAEATKAAEAAAEAQRKAIEAQRAMGDAMGSAGVNAFGKMIAMFEREADILERIRGPMREYYADLVALDALHQKGAISTAEFADEMERLTRGKRQAEAAKAAATIGFAAPAQPAGPSLGELRGGVQVAMGAAAALGINELVGKTREAIEHFQYLGDAYILASNAAVKFVDSTHDVTRIMNEQLVAANQLHSNYHTTIEIYDTVRDGIDELSFSHREQIRILETLGKASQIAGKSLGSVGGLVERLAYAAARGTIEQRELNTIMRQVPDIAQLWTDKFGVSRKELLNLVQQGKIGTTQLIDALVTGADTVDKNFKKIQRTERQQVEQVEENIGLFISAGASRGEAIRKALEVAQGMAPVDYQGAQGMMDQAAGLRKTWTDLAVDFAEAAESVAAASQRAHDALFRKLIKDLMDAPSVISRVSTSLMGLAVTVGTATDPWGEKKTGFLAEFAKLRSIKGPIDEARIALQNLQAVRGQLTSDEFRNQYEQLITTINDGRLPATIKLWHELHDPIREVNETIDAVSRALEHGGISAAQYNVRLNAIYEAMAKERADAQAQERAMRGVSVGPRNYGGVGVSITADVRPEAPPKPELSLSERADTLHEVTVATRLLNEEYERQFDLAGQLVAPELAYEQTMRSINGALALNAISQRQAALATEQAKDAYQAAKDQLAGYASIVEQFEGPADRYQKGLRAAGAALEDSRINAQQYAQAVDQIRSAYLAAGPEGKTFTGGLEQAFLKAKLGAQSFGQQVADTLVNDIQKLSDALVDMAFNGEVSWRKMVDAMLSDLARLAARQLAMGLINLGIQAATGSAPVSIPGVNAPVTLPSQVARAGAYPAPSAAAATAAASIAGSATRIKIINVFDQKEIHAAMDSRDGEQVTVNQMRRNSGAVRSYSGTRR